MRDTQPETQEEKPSPILILSTKTMHEKIGEDEMHRVHLMVVPSLDKKFLLRWIEKEESNPSIKKFIIFFPKTDKSEDGKYKIHSMLSGEKTEQDGKNIYTICNTFTEDPEKKNASKLVLELAKLAGEGAVIQACLNLKLDENGKIMKLEKGKQKELLSELNEKFIISSDGIKFNEGVKENRDFIEELQNAELWKNLNFNFFCSFLQTPGMKLEIEVGESGKVNLVSKVIITQDIIKFTEERLAKTEGRPSENLKNPSISSLSKAKEPSSQGQSP